MARMRDSKGRFIKASQIVVETVPEVEQVVPTQEQEQIVARSDIEMTGEAIVLGQENVEQTVDKEEVETTEIKIEKPVKKARFNTENSRANAIEAALVTGAASIDEIVDTVMEARPEDDPKKVKGQIRAILRDIKDGRGRWKKYDISNEEGMIQIMVK